MKRIKRKITRIRNYVDPHANGTKGSNILFLECGHLTTQKGSIKIPQFVYCVECEDWESGRTISRNIGNVVETWDAEKQMPIFKKGKP